MNVTTRHCEIDEALETRARAVAERIGTVAVRPIECTVLFDAEGQLQVAELRLRDARGESFIGRGEGENHRTALDRAEERLRRQLQSASGRARSARRGEPAEG
ncbi:MAG: HPF/RaiA family ribosome-associated protein [Gemmatimonadales bacterium]|nr:HPF/RaiA family ribosome-associated protein [Gemmatimonadales bacterium]